MPTPGVPPGTPSWGGIALNAQEDVDDHTGPNPRTGRAYRPAPAMRSERPEAPREAPVHAPARALRYSRCV